MALKTLSWRFKVKSSDRADGLGAARQIMDCFLPLSFRMRTSIVKSNVSFQVAFERSERTLDAQQQS
jgi:hypothetical protein